MIYAFVSLTITNPQSIAAYREKAADALAKHGGAVAGASPTLTGIEGNPHVPDMAAVLSFPDRDAAMAWIEDPELQPVHALRQGAGKSDILLLG